MGRFDHFSKTRGGRIFLAVWVGQLASTLGSETTRFGLAIWVFLETGSTIRVALVVLAGSLPSLLMSPFAGSLVDRWDRRFAMIVSDAGAAVGTLAIAVLFATDSLEMWHLYLALSFSSAFASFQFPAYSSATTLLVPKSELGRAAGMVQLAGGIGSVAAPALAGLLVVSTGLTTIFVIDFVTFMVALVTLLSVKFPRVEASSSGAVTVSALLSESKQGLDFVTARRGLFVLLLTFSAVNFAFGFLGVLMIPLLLSLTSEAVAGLVVSVGSLGLIAGSIFMSVWGGSGNRINDLFLPIIGLGGALILGGLRPELTLVFAALVLAHLLVPIGSSASQALWQAKVPVELQGRVFAIRQMVSMAVTPAAYVLAGVLAERVFGPSLMADGSLADSVGRIVGTGPGRGMGFLIAFMGVVVVTVSLIAWRLPVIRNLDRDVPDAELPDLEGV